MTKLIILSLLLLSFNATLSLTADSPTDFILTECQATLYPPLCVQCLSGHSTTIKNSPKQLVVTSLSVTLSRAQSVSHFISTAASTRGLKPTEHRVLMDCADNMANTVDQLSRSVKELSGVPLDFSWRVNNVKSWVTAAVTFQQTCLDGFSGLAIDAGNVEAAVKKRVLDCAHVTRNSLALVHRFAAKHKSGVSAEGTSVP